MNRVLDLARLAALVTSDAVGISSQSADCPPSAVSYNCSMT